jgi:hypothetical protein
MTVRKYRIFAHEKFCGSMVPISVCVKKFPTRITTSTVLHTFANLKTLIFKLTLLHGSLV